MEKVQNYISENKERFLEELLDLLRIPSVSADPAFSGDVQKTAKLVAKQLKAAGCKKVKINKTKGHPIVTGERFVSKKLPTVLVYGHYDVQPADPIELWDSPPFEPVIKKTKLHKNGAIFARGACDDKGQMYMHIKAMEAMSKSRNIPCNVKFMIEGEEEVGSDNLEAFIKKNKKDLKCDVVLVSDTSIISNKVPSITTGLRGLSYLEVEVTGPNRDLHSGVYGGAVANPINVLADMISSLKGKNGKIRIPSFYDDVLDVSKAERAAMNEAPFSITAYKRELKIKDTMGERGYTVLEQTSIRPTLDVNGIWGGYIGEGAKTVLPSKAFAKISMRLVPNQDPDKITKLFTKHFKSIAPAGVTVNVTPHHGGEPAVTPTDTTEYQAASLALEKTYGKTPIPQRSGGSIPIVSLFEKFLKVKTILMGFGLDTDDIHSPNEHFGVDNYFKGIETIPYFYQYYADLKSGKSVDVAEAEAKPVARRRGRPAKAKTATTEGAKPAAKRGRGRPKKATSTTATKPAAKKRGRPAKAKTANSVEAKPAVKRGRGRPKKAASTTATKPTAKKRGRPAKAKTATTEGAKPAVKRGRGRPKKATSTTATKPAAKKRGRPAKAKTATTEGAKPAVKRGRGRPKKATTTTATKPAAKKRGRPAKAKTAATEGAKPAVKRGRGRPKKATSTTTTKPAAKKRGRPAKAKTATTEGAKLAVKRGRGRPKKVTAAKTAKPNVAKGADKQNSTEISAPTKPVAKKRGRPSKVKAAATPKPITSGKRGRPAKAKTTKSDETKPTVKRGRGRPKKDTTK